MMVAKSYRTNTDLPHGQLKFVLGPKKEQWEELDDVISQFREAGVNWPVWKRDRSIICQLEQH